MHTCMRLNSPEWLGNSDMIEVRSHTIQKTHKFTDFSSAFGYLVLLLLIKVASMMPTCIRTYSINHAW